MKPILLVWFAANFLLIGVVSAALGSWYLSQPPLAAMALELGLVMLPNLALAVWFRLRESGSSGLLWAWRESLGWNWSGWRTLAVGLMGFAVLRALSMAIATFIGPSIPYSLPGSGAPVEASTLPGVVGIFGMLLLFVVLTVAGEETMFRGLIQGEATRRLGPWLGILIASGLFGLRHLPADVFYARAWAATPSMWLSRQLELYAAAIVLALTRSVGRSTYSSGIAHALLLVTALFGW